jgi:exodeoxyribonuclease V beta subunit
VALFHDAAGTRIRDVGGPGGSAWKASVSAHQREEDGEDLRLLYVAATRARSGLTLWWARSTTTANSALNRLLFGGPEAAPRLPDEPGVAGLLEGRVTRAGGGLAVVRVTPRQRSGWVQAAAEAGNPTAAVFDRDIDLQWRRTSYSALTASAHAAVGAPPAVGDEPAGTLDEPDAPAVDGRATDPGPVPLPPLGELPGGTAFGTLVHSVLEVVDPGSPDLSAALAAACEAALRATPVPGVTASVLAGALAVTLHTPLGPALQGRSLAGFGRRDRLCELEFELPLAGGDRPRSALRLADLAPVLERTLDPADPALPWLPRLREPELADQPLRGYLTGSIDAVLRLDSGAHVIVDYKTNRLHPPQLAGSLWHYRTEAMTAAMRTADYLLQALLYQVALHRYLTWRQIGYDPERHLGGALYLFLRGMPGPLIPPPGDEIPGVFAWRPTAAAVVATSELLAAGA